MKGFTPEEMERKIECLQKQYPLLDNRNIKDIWRCSHSGSPYEGTLIIEKEDSYICFSYDKDIATLQSKYPNVEIISLEKISPVVNTPLLSSIGRKKWKKVYNPLI